MSASALAIELGRLIDVARPRGGMVDIHALEALLARHGARLSCDCQRPDLLAGDQLSRVMAP